MENQVRVQGTWASTYSKRVELALKLKGIPYKYVEEDLINKSQSLLGYNPVHKKVPVLVHNGMPLAESFVILEYIDEAWPNHSPRLLPDDPYERSTVRFWASYLHNELLEGVRKLFKSTKEAQQEALNELHEKMSLMEAEMTEFIQKHVSSMDQSRLGLLDIQVVALFGAYKAQEEVIGKNILDPQKHPHIFSWVTALMNLPLIQQNTPEHHKLVPVLQMLLKTAQSA